MECLTSVKLTENGLLPPKPWQTLSTEELGRILDPATRSKPVKAAVKVGNSGLRRKRTRPTSSAEMLERVTVLAKQIGMPDIHLSEADIMDLEHIDHITQMEIQIMRMAGNEAEMVETEKWNTDVVQQLLNLSLTEKQIPFGKRDKLFDLRPTFDDPSPKAQDQSDGPHKAEKGKERAADDPLVKISIYQLLPADAEQSWLGDTGEYGKYCGSC
jgi:hypothetical protein